MNFAVDIAIRAARTQLQQRGQDAAHTSAEEALHTLADVAQSNADLLASIWYTNASAKQMKTFKEEWVKRQPTWEKDTDSSRI